MQNAIWFIAGILLIVLGVIFSVGALLPRHHVASRSIWLKQSPEEIWKITRDIEGIPTWRKGVSKVELLTNSDPAATSQRWVEHMGRNKMTYLLDSENKPNKFVTRIDDNGLPFGGSWTYELTEHNDGTNLRITEAGFVKPPPFRFIARFFMGYSKTIEGYLTDLANKTGNEIKIDS